MLGLTLRNVSPKLGTYRITRILFLFILLSLFLVPSPVSADHCFPARIDAATLYSNYLADTDAWIPTTYNLGAGCDTDTDGEGRADNYALGLIANADIITEPDPSGNLFEEGTLLLNTVDAAIPVWGNNQFSSGFCVPYFGGRCAVGAGEDDFGVESIQISVRRLGDIATLGPLTLVIQLATGSAPGGCGVPNECRPINNGVDIASVDYTGVLSDIPVGGVNDITFVFPTKVMLSGAQRYVVIVRFLNGDGANNISLLKHHSGAGQRFMWNSADGGATWGFTPALGSYFVNYEVSVRNITTFKDENIITRIRPIRFGQNTAALYVPVEVPVGTHSLLLWDTSTTPPDPHSVYLLSTASSISIEGYEGRSLVVAGLDSFADLTAGAAQSIPILQLLMGTNIANCDWADNPSCSAVPGPVLNLSTALGLPPVLAFTLLTIAFSFAAMLVFSRFVTSPMIILFAGIIPVLFMVMQGFAPPILLIASGLFTVMTLVWQVLVKQNV